MGLMDKIEDKLHSNKGHSDNSKLQNSGYEDSSSNDHLRHPVGTGSTSQNYGSSTTDNYGSLTTGNYGSSTTGTGGLTGSHGTSSVGRDGYGHSSSGYDNTGSGVPHTGRSDLVGHGSDHHRSGNEYREGHSSGIHPSSNEYREAGTSGLGSGPREPYDPYSSKGQNTAANAATGYPGETSREGYGSANTYPNDPNVPRTRVGGVMNSENNPSAIPTAGGQRVGSTDVNDPYSSSTHHSSGHPIRDAAMAGGVASGHHGSSHNPQDASYMNRSGETGYGIGSEHHSSPTTGMGGMTGTGSSAPGIDPKKMSNAYEAGYRDGMEHAKEQMGMK